MRAAQLQKPGTMYLLPKAKKLKLFSGISGTDVASFIKDMKGALTLQQLQDEDAANFILAHLEGPAHQEI